MKITKTFWFSGINHSMGVVTGVTATGEKKGYIGLAIGKDEDYDKQLIAGTGAKLTVSQLEEILAELK